MLTDPQGHQLDTTATHRPILLDRLPNSALYSDYILSVSPAVVRQCRLAAVAVRSHPTVSCRHEKAYEHPRNLPPTRSHDPYQ